jgi:hypothetical protein
MVNNLEYRSTIKSKPYLFFETKKVASLILQGFNMYEIKEMALKENIFQVNTENRKREIAATVINRIKVLDEYLLQKLANGPIETAKLIVLYAIMKTDRLFFEFMNEVYREKLILRETHITDKDFSLFFQSKREQSETVASWNEYTFYKLKQVYIRVLYEAGLLKNKKGDREIIKPVVEPDFVKHFQENGDKMYLDILMGVK